jgi:GT2 family glycosyltransferase
MTGQTVAVVLTYNSRTVIDACLKSLLASQPKLPVIVADNASSDDIGAYVHTNYPEVEFIQNGANLGYAGGYNRIMRLLQKRGVEYMAFINPDLTVDPRCLHELASYLIKHAKTAIAAPKIYLGGSDTIYYAGADMNWDTGWSQHTGVGEPDTGQYDQIRPTDRANGACMMTRLSATDQAGYLDEEYFLYFEETDWCVRLQRAGYRTVYVPAAKAWHFTGTSSTGDNRPLQEYYMFRNQLLFMRKNLQPGNPVFRRWFRRRILSKMRKYLIPPTWSGVKCALAIGRGLIDYRLSRFGQR